MKTIKTLALAGALGLGMASGALHGQDTEGAGPLPGGPRFGPPKEILEKYDVNKDGRLDESERAALHQDIVDGKIQPPGRGLRGPRGPHMGPPTELLDKYDVNNDGKLDDAERAALQQDIKDGKVQPPPFGPGRRGLRPTPPSAKEVIAKFDSDNDSKLDEAELTAFFAAHRPPVPPGPGPGPDGPPPPDGAPEPPQQ